MSAALTRDDVLRIAELARLELTASEIELFTTQLANILEYVEEIRAADTTGVALSSHAINRPIDREDEPRPTVPRHEALANAPDAAPEAGLFKVPRVIG